MMEDERRETIHHMGRRCREWDYGARAIYMVTVSLKERGRAALAEWPRCLPVSGQAPNRAAAEKPLYCASAETPKITMPLTPLGEKVLACWRRIPEFWPMIDLLECQVMPDHFHGLLFVEDVLRPAGNGDVLRPAGNGRETRKTLGDVIRGFKTGCREVGWEEGYVDNILFRAGQLKRMAEYIRDNPRRLAEKRASPRLFRRVEDLAIDLPVSGQAQNLPVSGQAPNRAAAEKPLYCVSAETPKSRASAETPKICASAETPKFKAHFQAIGNVALLRWPVIVPVQCSRRDFSYRRVKLPTGAWKILRTAAGEPQVEYASPAFAEKCADALACARGGAALVSPCISHGEREIARRAHLAGARVITLRNKGFSKFEKPNGALFDQCAKGNLLMLAPAAWPYVPGEKPPTRESSLVLNRIAQLIAGEETSEIKYNGVTFDGIDAKVREATLSNQSGGAQ